MKRAVGELRRADSMRNLSTAPYLCGLKTLELLGFYYFAC
jgi:hypothetical protein